MRKNIGICLGLLFVFLCVGCTTRMADLTVVSTRNVRGIDYVEKARIKGEDCSHIILVFPTGVPNLEEAIDDALTKGHGDAMVDAVIYHKGFYIPPFYGQNCYQVEGTVVNTMEKSVRKEIK